MSSEAVAQSASRPAPIRRDGHEQRGGPRRVALHRSVRAATVIPATFATSLGVTHDVQIATFAVFGCFSLLVMADFGGRRPPRAVAYVVTACAGATLVAVGTLASPNAAVGAAVMLVVALGVSFAAVFGGYLAAAQTALLLAFVLAVALPAPVSAIPTRLEGWALAGVVSTLAGVFFWPWFERVALRKRAAEAILATADLVTALRRSPSDDELSVLRDAARAAIRAIRSEYARTAMRPAGPTRHDRAFVELVTELEQIVDISEGPFNVERPQRRPCIDEGDALTAAVTSALRESAAALAGGGGTPDIRAVEDARRAHRQALDRWAVDELRGGRSAEAVLAGIDADHTLRVIAYLTMALGANAAITVGVRPVEGFPLPVAIPSLEGARGTVLRVARTLRAHVDPTSTVLHNSLRVAVGLALSVLLARTLGLAHAFWVVLGTLSVLRSNALGTGRSTVQALVGSVIGFAIGAVFALVAGDNSTVMWIALPPVMFFASYAASAIGFVTGQAAFTVMVIIVFNLISPAGWQVGLVRIEDVAIGTAISVVVGLLLWPRGARRDVTRTIAGLYRAVVAYLERSFGMVLGVTNAEDAAEVREGVVRARARAGEAFDALLNERGAKPLEPRVAGRLISAGSQALLAGDLLISVAADLGYRAGACPDGVVAVERQLRALSSGIEYLAGELDGDAPRGMHPEEPSLADVRASAVRCMRSANDDEGLIRAAMAVVIAGEWLQNLGRLEADLQQPVKTAADASRIHWWR